MLHSQSMYHFLEGAAKIQNVCIRKVFNGSSRLVRRNRHDHDHMSRVYEKSDFINFYQFEQRLVLLCNQIEYNNIMPFETTRIFQKTLRVFKSKLHFIRSSLHCRCHEVYPK